MLEWFNRPVSKTGVPLWYRRFESYSRRYPKKGRDESQLSAGAPKLIRAKVASLLRHNLLNVQCVMFDAGYITHVTFHIKQ